MKRKCVFCDLEEERRQGLVLYESENFYVEPDIFGTFAPGHVLVTSKPHIICYGVMPVEYDREYLEIIQKTREKLTSSFSSPIASEVGIYGQSIKHAHIHVFPIWVYALPFSFVIFANAVILFLFIPLSLLIYNVARRDIKFPFCLVGYKVSLEKARQSFVWPCEKIKDGKRKFSYLPSDFDIEAQLKVFEKKGISEIWVTPKVPFMIPLLAGFLCSFILGDILFYLTNFII